MNFGDSRLPARFWDKVHPCPMSGCWLWTGAINLGGYGHLGVGSKRDGTRRPHHVHRLALAAVSDIGAMHVDHLCRVRLCCNPQHLEAVTPSENTRRGLAGRNNSIKSSCPKGHPYSVENTYFIPNQFRGGRSRACRQCKRIVQANYRMKAKAA